MFILIGLWLLFLWHQAGHRRALPYGKRSIHLPIIEYRSQRKPPWVKNELIRLKALMPVAGCRTLADIFNRRFAENRRMTVGKTYVSERLHQ